MMSCRVVFSLSFFDALYRVGIEDAGRWYEETHHETWGETSSESKGPGSRFFFMWGSSSLPLLLFLLFRCSFFPAVSSFSSAIFSSSSSCCIMCRLLYFILVFPNPHIKDYHESSSQLLPNRTLEVTKRWEEGTIDGFWKEEMRWTSKKMRGGREDEERREGSTRK